MNYLEGIAKRIQELATVHGHGCVDELARVYALLALTVGQNVTFEDVHNAWAVWRTATKPDHADLVPFEFLTHETQLYDAPFVLFIAQAAREYEESGSF